MPCPDPRRPAAAGAMALLLCLASLPVAGVAHAAGEVAGPIEIGPSWGEADAGHSTAILHTSLRNQGDLADRLIRVECPASGHVALQGGTVHQDVMAPNPSQAQLGAQRYGSQNGLDVPPATDGRAQAVQAGFTLTDARQPLTEGAHVPCSLYFAHDGQRIVVFTLGARPTPTPEP